MVCLWTRLERFLLETCHISQRQRHFVMLNIIKREGVNFNGIKLTEDELRLVIALCTRKNTEIGLGISLLLFFFPENSSKLAGPSLSSATVWPSESAKAVALLSLSISLATSPSLLASPSLSLFRLPSPSPSLSPFSSLLWPSPSLIISSSSPSPSNSVQKLVSFVIIYHPCTC